MRYRYFFLLSATLLVACSEPNITEETVKVYKPLGSLQCGGGNITPPETMRKELLNANIPVRKVACGNDGLIHPSMCWRVGWCYQHFYHSENQGIQSLVVGFRSVEKLTGLQRKAVRIAQVVLKIFSKARRKDSFVDT